MTVLYLAGPMRGYPRWNFDAFAAAASDLRARGYSVISPHELDLEAGFDPDRDTVTQVDLEKAIVRDVAGILTAEMIVLLPGWHLSLGAQAELTIARWAGRGALLYPDLQPYEADRDILQEAAAITSGDRNTDYGPPQEDFAAQAQMWSLILGVEVKPHQIALCMTATKICRARVSPKKRDHWVDIAGYARCGWMCASGERANGKK